jgi:amino acid adenylation domain-containing protein
MLRDKQRKAQRAPAAPITRGEDRSRLSAGQSRLWFADRLAPDSALYTIGGHFRLEGSLSIAALEKSLGEIVLRHEALRTNIEARDGEPALVVAPTWSSAMVIVDIASLAPRRREAEAARLAAEEAHRAFDLGRDSLLRATLIRLAETSHVLLITVHHIASDGWSMGLLYRELSGLYRGFVHERPPALPELPIQYADFAAWQRARLANDVLGAELAYWRERLAGATPVLDLPMDRPRPAIASRRAGHEPFELSGPLRAAVVALARAEGATVFMTLLAAFLVLLQRYSGEDDLVVGTPVAGRNRTETECLIGLFINTLVLRADLSGDPSFVEVLRRVREGVVADFAHQELPFERVIEELRPTRSLSYSPLFQVMFILQNATSATIDLEGITTTSFPVDSGAIDLDLSLVLVEAQGGITGSMRYSADLFDVATIRRLIGSYRTLLEAAVIGPEQPCSRLGMLTSAEREAALYTWNRTAAAYPEDRCIDELVAAQAARTPDAIAVAFEGEEVTYAALAVRARQVALQLGALGLGRGALVAIYLERSIAMVAALLGVLEAGCAYVPLDPDLPPERVAFMLADAGVAAVITDRRLATSLPASEAVLLRMDEASTWAVEVSLAAPEGRGGPGDVAYVIYTSGSTGRPKGVAVPHRAVVNFLSSMARTPGLSASDVLVAVTTLSFDIAGLELWLPLTVGARIELASRGDASDGERLRALLASSRATVMQATPATWRMLVEAGFRGPPGFKVLCGGEALAPELGAALAERASLVYNLFGPTETTIWSTLHRVVGSDVAVGHPIANTEIYVLDRNLSPVPVGVAGEVYIGGLGVAVGYWHRPELTSARFVGDPFGARPGGRLYRTGDRGRFRADGALEHLGRFDGQIKLRGYRIEPGEVEAVLGRQPGVRQAVVILREDIPGDARLVAYLVTEGEAPAVIALKQALAAELPSYMVPSSFVVLDALPRTPNGKLDRRALPAPGGARDDAPARFTAPGDRLEAQLVRLWEEILAVHPVSTQDDFFALGGHSLLAARLFDRIEQQLGRRLPIALLFQAPTIERLADLLRRGGWSPSWSSLVAIQTGGSLPALFCVHAIGANVLNYRLLSAYLGAEQPFYGLQAQGLDGAHPPHDTVEEMAAHYIQEIRAVQPKGPYRLGGASSGGVVAFEMAQQLRAQGDEVSRLVLLDTFLPRRVRELTAEPSRSGPLYLADVHLGQLLLRPARAWPEYALSRIRERLDSTLSLVAGRLGLTRSSTPLTMLEQVVERNKQAMARYVPRRYPGRVTMFLYRDEPFRVHYDPRVAWADFATEGLEVRLIRGNHERMLDDPYVADMAAELGAFLAGGTT